ncbi:MAG: phosphoglucomutase [Desulfurococcales archaeon]|nr:phosphoglucomutase [Desulfurococcales archaeon]
MNSYFRTRRCALLVPKLFGTAGIRKTYPVPLDPVLAYKLGLAVANIIGNKGVGYIVRDPRITGPVLSLAFMSGLMAGGMDAGYIGLAPTPIAAYAALWHGVLGVSVTASHNPPEYNGFKFYDRDGYEFTRDLEEKIEKQIDRVEPLDWRSSRNFFYANEVIDEYIDDMVNRLMPERRRFKPRIVIDLANGASYIVTPTVTRSLGAEVITINGNPDGYFPGRPPEPRKDVLEKLMPIYRGASPHLILAHDGDADRLAVLDPKEGFIRQDSLIALYAAMLLMERKGLVVVSIDTGRVIDDVVERYGGRVERYVLGKTHERVKELGANNIVLAAEPWKLIDPRWGPWVDGVWQAGLLTKILIEEGKPLPQIMGDLGIKDYPWDRRSYLITPHNLRDQIYSDLVESLYSLLGEPDNVITIDGYRFEYSDGSWILLRKSGTEPKIRLYSEAPDKERLKTMVDSIEKKLFSITKKYNGSIAEITYG